MLLRQTENKEILTAAAELAREEKPARLNASLSVIHCVDTGRVLVTHRAKDGQLGLPCGKADAGEMTLETAYRELEEETGVRRVDLVDGLGYMQDINMSGCIVSVYVGVVPLELKVGPEKGFESEGPASWMKPEDIAKTPSRFQNFNTVVLFNAGLI